MATKRIPGKRTSVITGVVPAGGAPVSLKLAEKEKPAVSPGSPALSNGPKDDADDALMNVTMLVSQEQGQVDQIARKREKVKAETAALKASLKEPRQDGPGDLLEEKQMAENGLVSKRDIHKGIQANCSSIMTRRTTLQTQIAQLEKQRLDQVANSSTSASYSAEAIEKARPASYTAEGRKLSRLERVRDDFKEQYSTACSKRDVVQVDTNDFKEQQRAKRAELDKCSKDRTELQGRLKELEAKAAAGAGQSQAALDAKIAEGKQLESKLAELKNTADQEEAKSAQQKRSYDSMASHPHVKGPDIDVGRREQLQKKKDALLEVLEKGENDLAAQKKATDATLADLQEAHKDFASSQEEVKELEEAARADHTKRQKVAYERLEQLSPASKKAGLDVTPFDPDKLTLLADTHQETKLIKVPPALTLVMLEILLRNPQDVSALKSIEEELVLERGKTEALEVRLASFKTKAALSGRDNGIQHSPGRSRRNSGGSMQFTDVPSEMVEELQARYARVEQISTILANRHRQLVQIEGELKHDAANLELSLCA